MWMGCREFTPQFYCVSVRYNASVMHITHISLNFHSPPPLNRYHCVFCHKEWSIVWLGYGWQRPIGYRPFYRCTRADYYEGKTCQREVSHLIFFVLYIVDYCDYIKGMQLNWVFINVHSNCAKSFIFIVQIFKIILI